jgi:RNA polymerase sigma-70 factor (ECF subfamily)
MVSHSESKTPAPIPPASGGQDDFVCRLTGAQSQLYAFICSLLGGTRDASDVLQETNMVLWRKVAEYDPSREFLTWAYTIARYQVMAQTKRLSRNRMVLDDDLVEQVAAVVAEDNEDLESRLRALDDCIGKLPERQREMVRRRYADRASVKSLAGEYGQTPTALAVLLHRVRLALGRCVERSVAGGETP